MRLTTTLAVAAALAVSGVAANAGGNNDAMMEAPVVMVEPAPAPAPTSSISPTFVVIGVLAALLIAAAVNEAD